MKRAAPALIPVLLLMLTIGAFIGVRHNDFINYDDPAYVLKNLDVQQGLNWRTLTWAFTTFDVSNWHPLTWLSYLIDYELFGLDPAGYHLVNLGIHAAAVLVLWGALYRMTGAPWSAAVVAALFAVHPTRVQSVAWIGERKDVLSALFWCATIWAHAGYARRPSARWRLIVVVAMFALGIMSKPMLVTLPFVLLLLDYWPLRRLRELQPAEDPTARRIEFPVVPLRQAVIEKLPLFALVGVSVVLTFIAQSQGGAVQAVDRFPLAIRLYNVVVAYASYLVDLLRPTRLAIFYPYPETVAPALLVVSATVLILLTAAAIVLRRRHPYFIVGWLWFIGTLIPVIGLVQVGEQARADRYTYIPYIGLFLAAVWGGRDLLQRWPRYRPVAAVLTIGIIVGCALRTRQEVEYWNSTRTLFQRAVDVTERNHVAHLYLGMDLASAGEEAASIEQYHRALAIRPWYSAVHYNLANVYARTGQVQLALQHYDTAIEVKPSAPQPYQNKGALLAALGQIQAAETTFRQGVAAAPESPELRVALGAALKNQGQWDEALEQYRAAVQLDPRSELARKALDTAERQYAAQRAGPPRAE